MALIYKICTGEEWRETETRRIFPGAPVDIADGFIHFSTGDQVAETAVRHFAGQHGLMVLSVNIDDLGPALKWEVSRGGARFPHLYGDLKRSQIVSADPLPLGPDGHCFPGHIIAP